MTHMRFAGLDDATQRRALEQIMREAPHVMDVLKVARDMDLPDWWLVSGAIYNTVWNHLTGRDLRHGIKDVDLFYFDPDTSWDAEDRVIKRGEKLFHADPPVEIRNQARVHLWYEKHFGEAYPPLGSSREGIDRFACRTHCVAARLEPDDRMSLYAPFGLDDIFAFRITPNPVLNNRATHEAKSKRQKTEWPELTIVPWPDA
ncbi:nucleotidyltransferase family protein [Aliiroseovarius sp. F20344]|uniref:nucleotidyltransferase family protein n=1 Tax=Aliiroseovarius sp. F20344 TaxID=2926414 RepID=UPI001FF149F8|nr:nucleotidyltransferase family protein [Aliiroseovarius sp. F20344]MCK0140990.1 nucleotidyltransferase family protein [Aliiroseovarius sp. F20344]